MAVKVWKRIDGSVRTGQGCIGRGWVAKKGKKRKGRSMRRAGKGLNGLTKLRKSGEASGSR
jgi:hypothetical protein